MCVVFFFSSSIFPFQFVVLWQRYFLLSCWLFFFCPSNILYWPTPKSTLFFFFSFYIYRRYHTVCAHLKEVTHKQHSSFILFFSFFFFAVVTTHNLIAKIYVIQHINFAECVYYANIVQCARVLIWYFNFFVSLFLVCTVLCCAFLFRIACNSKSKRLSCAAAGKKCLRFNFIFDAIIFYFSMSWKTSSYVRCMCDTRTIAHWMRCEHLVAKQNFTSHNYIHRVFILLTLLSKFVICDCQKFIVVQESKRLPLPLHFQCVSLVVWSSFFFAFFLSSYMR